MDFTIAELEQEVTKYSERLKKENAEEAKAKADVADTLQNRKDAQRESNKATGMKLPNALDAKEKAELAEFRYIKAKKTHASIVSRRQETIDDVRWATKELAEAKEKVGIMESYDSNVEGLSGYIGIYHDDKHVTFELCETLEDNRVIITAYELDQMIIKLSAIAAKLL